LQLTGLIDGRSRRSADEAELLNAACQVAFGSALIEILIRARGFWPWIGPTLTLPLIPVAPVPLCPFLFFTVLGRLTAPLSPCPPFWLELDNRLRPALLASLPSPTGP